MFVGISKIVDKSETDPFGIGMEIAYKILNK